MNLFHNNELRAFFESIKQKIKQEIEYCDEDYLLKVSENEYANYLISKNQIEPIYLKIESAVLNFCDIDIDVRNDQNYFITDRSSPHYIKGTRMEISIPFEGDPQLFQYQPLTSNYTPPKGIIRNNNLELYIDYLQPNEEEISRQYQSKIEQINNYLGWQKKEIDAFQNEIVKFLRESIENRKKKILSDKKIAACLNIPLKRTSSNQTYEIPEIKRKIVIKPQVASEKFKSEPTLSQEEYNNILKIIQSMIITMERSPSVFSKLKEEELRDIILVQLNGHYEGLATGETFNASGKTDILIRFNDKNIFIAECKIWHGSKELLAAIDQLLNYLSWRDTKTAIIIFNKTKGFSDILKKIGETVKTHPNYKNFLGEKTETNFQYLFHQKNDTNRELYLSILTFDIKT
jgi:hypothetical protein